MPHFVKRLEVTHQGCLNFYFNLIYTPYGERYHVSVVSRDKKAVIFNMEEHFGTWRLVDPATCPGWIVAMQRQLSTEIIKHRNGHA